MDVELEEPVKFIFKDTNPDVEIIDIAAEDKAADKPAPETADVTAEEKQQDAPNQEEEIDIGSEALEEAIENEKQPETLEDFMDWRRCTEPSHTSE